MAGSQALANILLLGLDATKWCAGYVYDFGDMGNWTHADYFTVIYSVVLGTISLYAVPVTFALAPFIGLYIFFSHNYGWWIPCMPYLSKSESSRVYLSVFVISPPILVFSIVVFMVGLWPVGIVLFYGSAIIGDAVAKLMIEREHRKSK